MQAVMLPQAQGLRDAVAGLRAQLQDARRDEAAASATRDILAEQLHAATDAMAEQVPLAHVTAYLSTPLDCCSVNEPCLKAQQHRKHAAAP
jgi:hypothetical protein